MTTTGAKKPCGNRKSSASRPRWRIGLPMLHTPLAVLREVRVADAAALARSLGQPDVTRYLPVGPITAEEFARFARWAIRERRAGRYLCFAVAAAGAQQAAGLFQLWPVEPGFGTAELGFALDPALWGTGVFRACAEAMITFAFYSVGARRIEFRSGVGNERAIGALLKLGAVYEGTLRQCFLSPTGPMDYAIWSILREEWPLDRASRHVRLA